MIIFDTLTCSPNTFFIIGIPTVEYLCPVAKQMSDRLALVVVDCTADLVTFRAPVTSLDPTRVITPHKHVRHTHPGEYQLATTLAAIFYQHFTIVLNPSRTTQQVVNTSGGFIPRVMVIMSVAHTYVHSDSMLHCTEETVNRKTLVN